MILLWLILVLSTFVIGERRTREVVAIVDVPAGFALRYINIFFTPSFVLLPLSPPIGGIEVAKIMGVFAIGFLVMVAFTAYFVRGLQLVTGSHKRAVIERAEEMGDEDDAIPLTDRRHSAQHHDGAGDDPDSGISNLIEATQSQISMDPIIQPIAPERIQDPGHIRATAELFVDNVRSQAPERPEAARQTPLPLSRPQRWAAYISNHFDAIVYTIILLFVGLPVYYTTGYAMPAQLSLNILAYFGAISIPAKWRQFLHPVLVSAAITVLGIWILGLMHGDGLYTVLAQYKTGTGYLQLWMGARQLQMPGAGDIFGCVLDASIVALALPMFQYRKELKQHFVAIVVPNIAVSVASLFGYPPLCYAIGISAQRSLAFAARSLTLALATPAVSNLGGDNNTVAALCIMSGILGVLIGPRLLAWLRIPDGRLPCVCPKPNTLTDSTDDYVTRGVTLGGNSSAIATALLLLSDPRAAALSSLSMSLFGTITVALTSIPPVAQAVRSLVGL
jgi:putative effector of murein hydrolase